MSATMKDLVREIIQTEKDADTWDEPPAMFIATQPIPPEERAAVSVVILHQALPLFETLYYLGEAFLNPELTANAPNLDTPLMGVAVRWEAWGMKLDSEEELDKFVASGRSAADHPNGIELVGVLGIDTTGMYSAGYERGADDVTLLSLDDVVDEPKIEGRLATALEHLFEGLQTYNIRCMAESSRS